MLEKIGMLGHVFTLKSCSLLLLALLFLLPAGIPATAHADDGTSTTCAKQLKSSSTTPGTDIITAVFAAINAVLSKIGQAMYQGIIGNTGFTNVVNVTLSLYVAIYGVMVMTNLAPLRLGEVAGRLIRVAIVYGLLGFSASGWTMFSNYFSGLFLGGMNELISSFANAAGVPVPPPAPTTGFGVTTAASLDINAVKALYAPMNLIYQPFYIFTIIGLFFLNIVCALMAVAMIWAFWDFTLMILGALITYIKAVVGLTFLFGIAPLFIICILFERTRQLFFGWVNQCLAFAVAPVLLFAFLSFYTVLLSNVINGLFSNIDFCWGKMMSVPGTTTDLGMWRPAKLTQNGTTYSWVQQNGAYQDANGNDLPPPFNIVSVLLFVVIAHLGKNFANQIGQISYAISSAVGPGVTTPEQVGQFINNKVTGGKGISDVASKAFKSTKTQASALATKRT